MRLSLARLIEPNELLALASIETGRSLPMTSACPFCHQHGSLEISRGRDQTPVYWCQNPECWFTGDGIELASRIYGKSLVDTCLELMRAGILRLPPNQQDESLLVTEYAMGVERYRKEIWSVWQQANQNVLSADTYACGLLQELGCWQSEAVTCSVRGFGRHVGVLRGSVIRDMPKLPKHLALTIRAASHYLVVPMWVDRREIIGFTLVGRGQELWRWPITPNLGDGIGLIHTTRQQEEYSLGCTGVRSALRLLAAGLSSATTVPAVFVRGQTANWTYLSAQYRILVNDPAIPDSYGLAMQVPDCRITNPTQMEQAGVYRADHPRTVLRLIRDSARPPHEALAAQLISLSTPAALSLIRALQLGVRDIHSTIAAAPEAKRDQLRLLFKQDTHDASVQFNGDTITSTKNGWVSAKRGQICNAMFYIDKIVADRTTLQGTATGVVIQGDREFPFTAPVNDIRTRTVDWLSTVLIENQGQWLRVAPGWGNKLFEIAQSFRQPETVHHTSVVGWTEDKRRLVLPHLLIEAGQISPNPHPIQAVFTGCNLRAVPSASTASLEELCRDDEAGGLFWALMCGLVCNLYAPFHQHGSLGIGVVDCPNGMLSHVVSGLADQVGLERVAFRNANNTRIQEISRLEQRSPLPILIEETWAGSDGFTRWLANKQQRNCLVQMTKPAAIGTCLDGGWCYIRSQVPAAQAADRLIELWPWLSAYVAWTQHNPITWPKTKSDLLTVVLDSFDRWLVSLGGAPARVLSRARRHISIDMLDRTASSGSKLVSLLIECVESGLLRMQQPGQPQQDGIIVDNEQDVLFLSRAAMALLFGQLGLPLPPHAQIVASLTTAKALAGTQHRGVSGYCIPLEQWGLYYSLRG